MDKKLSNNTHSNTNSSNCNSFLKNDCDLLAPCPRCGSTQGTIKPTPSGSPHTASLNCAECSRWIKWVGKQDYANFISCRNNQDQSAVGGMR